VNTDGVKTDAERLTALVLLGIRDEHQFPLIFYRENCADMALCEDDIAEDFIASSRAVIATGTHLSHPRTEAAVLKALKLARKHGAQTALDIDYRPNLWGLAGHGDGESRFIESAAVTAKLQASLHFFDLIVGTEEEFHIAGGSTDTITVRAFAFDHRSQLEDVAGATPEKIGRFKELCLDATLAVSQGREGFGILCDNRLGKAALHRASGQGLWIGRPVEWPGSRPLTLEPEIGPDYGGLSEWALENVVKVLCFCHPDDQPEMQTAQEATITRLFHACRRNRLEMLLEVIPSKVGAVDDLSTAKLISRFYDIGIYPDWWKLEPMQTDAAWAATCDAINARDPHVQGIVVLGLGQSEGELAASFRLAAKYPLVKGFAVGRTIHGDVGRAWMAGEVDDATAIATMADNFHRLVTVWDGARAAAGVSA
jgi:myo-inositol catabolism protein IolC